MVEHTIDSNLACSVYWWTCCHLACREYYLLWLSSCLTVAVAWHDWYMITVLSPCRWSKLLTTIWHVWYTDEHVFTLLAEHTILLPGRRPHINFRVSLIHLKNIHTIVSSFQNHLGIPSLQQLAFRLYHGGFVSWRVQEQEPLGQSKGSVKVSWEWEKA
jgi:hypothetical protein